MLLYSYLSYARFYMPIFISAHTYTSLSTIGT